MKRTILFLGFLSLLMVGSPTKPAKSQVSRSAKNDSPITMPNLATSVRFAVIGDTGTGQTGQRQLAEVLAQRRQVFPFEFVLLVGDNLYGGEDASDYEEKFAQPYKKLLDAGVVFYAALGNHDKINQRFYEKFNMGGKEYYTFKKGTVRFFALNSNYMDPRQISWLDGELKGSGSEWKICFFHHPTYSSGSQHGSDTELRKIVEPLFVKYGVDAVFNGHEHFYERIKPQQGVHYFITGAGGKLRPNGLKASKLTGKSFDQDLHFMLVEIAGDVMHFQVISRAGKTVDSGVLARREVRTTP